MYRVELLRQLRIERGIMRTYKVELAKARKSRNRGFANALKEQIVSQGFRIVALQRMVREYDDRNSL